jgi:hypothetical protein
VQGKKPAGVRSHHFTGSALIRFRSELPVSERSVKNSARIGRSANKLEHAKVLIRYRVLDAEERSGLPHARQVVRAKNMPEM